MLSDDITGITNNGSTKQEQEATTTKQRDEVDEILKNCPLSEDTTCGIWFLKSTWLQKFANKKVYILIYGLVGCIFGATTSYFFGTISTLEKRFKISSQTTGIIIVGGEISQLFASVILSYYAGRGHRPRWIAVGLCFIIAFCLLTALPHLIYGSGKDALILTTEYDDIDENSTTQVRQVQQSQTLCQFRDKSKHYECENTECNFAPLTMLFLAQFVAGLGGTLYHTLGVSYMDDNIKKSKAPALLSFSFLSRMLGPAVGYTLASMCLKIYISPTLTPVINNKDPRWLGAWWLGWLILSVPLLISAFLISLFPKTLPRAAARNMIKEEKLKLNNIIPLKEDSPSLKDLVKTCKRLLRNNILMLNTLASVFYIFGMMPYWAFMPKYIEMQYRQSASVSSFVTGTIGFVFCACGVIASGLIISKYKPSARYLAAWNVFIGVVSVVSRIMYAFLGCDENDGHIPILPNGDQGCQCNSDCYCDYIRYSPVCSTDGLTTFISACHAGCRRQHVYPNGSQIFTECTCISPSGVLNVSEFSNASLSSYSIGGTAIPGSCPVNCNSIFYVFLGIMCLWKFAGASGKTSDFLISVRSVQRRDKPVAMGFNLMITKLFANIPSPIIFGFIIDKACLVWGKTCSGKGNCWLYDVESLRYIMNFTSVVFLTMGTLFDTAVWYYVKDLKIFEEEVEMKVIKKTDKDDT